jgi:DNA end-binding protein Ku
MAPRAFWTGQLRLSLVTIPIRLYPGTSTEKRIELHQIHEPTGKRIRYQKVAPGVGVVENENITKGFEYEKGKYVLLDQKEIDDLKLEAKQTIELARFVHRSDIDPRFFEKPYYLLPNGEGGEEGYVVIQKALADTGKVGLGQLILRGQGNIVGVHALGRGLMLEVLRYANEIRSAEKFFEEVPEMKVDEEALRLAKELIARKEGPFDPKHFTDDYNDAMWELIHAKLEHRKPEFVVEEQPTANVINIMDALKKSVQQGKGERAAASKRSAAAARGTAKRTGRAAPKGAKRKSA